MICARNYLLIETEKILSIDLDKPPDECKVKNVMNPVSLVHFSFVVLCLIMVCVFGVRVIGWPPYVGIWLFIALCGCFVVIYGKVSDVEPVRMAVASRIMYRVLFPKFSRVGFVEAIIADMLTSLSRILADGALALLLVFCMWTDFKPPGEYYRGVLMASFACIPHVLRIRQCLVLRKISPTLYSNIHTLNVIKYLSSFPVAWLTFTSQSPVLLHWLTYTQRRFLSLSCIVFNTVYYILWDVLMDWGLMQKGASGLRHERLLMPYRWMYYVAMILNAAGRFTWSVRWLHIFHTSFSSPVDGVLMMELVEVARRALWTVFRIEWEYVKPKMELLATNDSPIDHDHI